MSPTCTARPIGPILTASPGDGAVDSVTFSPDGHTFASLDELAGTLLAFVDRYNQTARPFNWKFTAADLARLLDRISAREHAAQNPAKLPEAA